MDTNEGCTSANLANVANVGCGMDTNEGCGMDTNEGCRMDTNEG